MGTLFKDNGEVSEVTPKNGKNFNFEEVKAMTGIRFIEMVTFRDGGAMMMDEDYVYNPDPSFKLNINATTFLIQKSPHTLIGGRGLMGGVLVLTKAEVDADRDSDEAADSEDDEEEDDEPDFTDGYAHRGN